MRRLRVAVLFGGRSGEHEVSLMSARSVLQTLDPRRYEVLPVGITREGRWFTGDSAQAVLSALERRETDGLQPLALVPQPGHPANPKVDVAFPVLHGPMGEDGTIQAVLELAEIPYVGAGVAASAVGMDKALMKALFRAAGLPVSGYRVVSYREWQCRRAQLLKELAIRPGFPAFVKPASLGSSVGVNRAANTQELEVALDLALQYDCKALVEASAEPAREIECSVLGNEEPVASLPGEVIPSRPFYDYVAKYEDPTTRLAVPAELPGELVTEIQRLAVAAFSAVDASGMARVDFFLRPDGQVLVNEINTIPGFTAVSMYPRLWEASGLPYPQLLDRLIDLALQAHARRAACRLAQASFSARGAAPSKPNPS